MPSSTSSFERPVPALPWPRVWALAAAIALLTLGGSELFWRARGYPAELRDDQALWALARRSVAAHDPNQVVLIGDSRMQNGISTAAFREVFSTPPVQLALVRAAATPILFNLADDPDFTGIVVSSVNRWDLSDMPELWTVAEDYLDYYRKLTPAQISDERIGMFLQQHLVFMLQDLGPGQLLAALGQGKLPDPPFYHLNPDRSRVTDYARYPLLALRRKQMEAEDWFRGYRNVDPRLILGDLSEIQAAVSRIKRRGGHVVFVRMPSTGPVRRLEERIFPREKFWRLWAEHTGAITIDFEDYPELSGFDCPDYVHLDYRSAGPFSRALAGIIKRKIDAEAPRP